MSSRRPQREPVPFCAVIRRLALAVGAAALLAVPATAAAAPKQPASGKIEAAVPKATVTVEASGLNGGTATILDEVPVTGTVSPYVPGQYVEVTFYLNGKKVVTHHRIAVQQGPNETGTFESSVVVREAGKYAPTTRRPRRSAPTRPCARAGRSASRS